MRTLYFSAFIGFLAIMVFVPQAYAAELVISSSEVPHAGTDIALTLYLDSQGENINAYEGTLEYPMANLRLRQIRDGNSIVSVWIERPFERESTIRFAGVTPGGYTGNRGELMTLIFEVNSEKNVSFRFRDARALLNDGEGTGVSFTLAPTLAVEPALSQSLVSDQDTAPPEVFTITRGQSSDLFEGKSFAVFMSQDKQSGIDHYEVGSSLFPLVGPLMRFVRFTETESPAVLPDSNSSYFYVKAIDQSGNERIARLSPDNSFPYAVPLTLIGILILLSMLLRRYVFHPQK